MGFKYQQEKNKFLAAWIHTVRRYRDAGMSCAQINEMYDFEWALFKQQRGIALHTEPMLQWDDGDIEAQSNLALKIISSEDGYFESICADMDILLNNLKPNFADHLTKRDKEILCLLCQGYNQQETCIKLGITQQAISGHINKIKNIFKKGL